MAAERRVRLLRPARAELAAAARRYEHEREGAGDSFLECIERAVGVIAAAPERWPFVRRGSRTPKARRYVLRGFPYSIVYRLVGTDAVEVVAIAHHKRRPGYWGSR